MLTRDCFFSVSSLTVSGAALPSSSLISLSNSLITLQKIQHSNISLVKNHKQRSLPTLTYKSHVENHRPFGLTHFGSEILQLLALPPHIFDLVQSLETSPAIVQFFHQFQLQLDNLNGFPRAVMGDHNPLDGQEPHMQCTCHRMHSQLLLHDMDHSHGLHADLNAKLRTK
jgi:hypothetical protein